MKLIIDINEEEYKEVLKDTYSGTPFENKIFTAISNGVPLDKIRAETAEEGIITGLDIAINVIKSMDMKQGAEQDI